MLYGDPDASTVLIQMVDDHDLEGIESEVAEIRRLTGQAFCLMAVKVGSWNRDLSPFLCQRQSLLCQCLLCPGERRVPRRIL